MTALAERRHSLARNVIWARDHLFDSRGNAALSIVSLLVGALLAFLVLKFVLFEANWGLVAINRRLFFIGSYPAEEEYRIWIAVFLAAVLAAVSYGVWVGRMKPLVVTVAVVAAVILTLGLGTQFQIEESQFSQEVVSAGQTTLVTGVERQLVQEDGWAPRWLYSLSLGLAVPFGPTWILVAILFATLIAAAQAGRYLARWRDNPILRQSIGAGWVLLVPITLVLQIGVSIGHWESVFLDVLVFAVGGVFSFLIGLMLALARSSRYAAIRLSAVGYIETVRAAPLLVWLLFATFLKDELGPIGQAFSGIDLVFRVMVVFAFFGGAYIAEVIRGGLQSIAKGQFEACEAISLSPLQMYVFIILPQAIKAVIPAIIGRFIALWKDTALLAAISLVNTLEKAKKVLGGQADIAEGAFFEVYIIVGLIYWTVSYVLSRLGGAAEGRLGQRPT